MNDELIKAIQRHDAELWFIYKETQREHGDLHWMTKNRLREWCAIKDLMDKLNIKQDYSLKNLMS